MSRAIELSAELRRALRLRNPTGLARAAALLFEAQLALLVGELPERDQAARVRILRVLSIADAALTKREVYERVGGLGWLAFDRHLRALERQGLVDAIDSDRRKRGKRLQIWTIAHIPRIALGR